MSLYLTDPAAWENAIRLAIAHGTQVRQLVGRPTDDYQLWEASSFSVPGHWWPLELKSSVNGVRFECDCPGHTHGHPCHHSAALFLELGFLAAPEPEPEPVDAPAEPSPDVVRLRGKVALSLLSGDDDYDTLLGEYDAIKNEMGR